MPTSITHHTSPQADHSQPQQSRQPTPLQNQTNKPITHNDTYQHQPTQTPHQAKEHQSSTNQSEPSNQQTPPTPTQNTSAQAPTTKNQNQNQKAPTHQTQQLKPRHQNPPTGHTPTPVQQRTSQTPPEPHPQPPPSADDTPQATTSQIHQSTN